MKSSLPNGVVPKHPWAYARPRTRKQESARVVTKRKRGEPGPSKLPPHVREILERTRKALGRPT